jgi:hypothetical protein
MRWNGTALAVQTDGWLDDEAKTAALLGEELYPPTAIAVLSPIAGSTESLEWLRIPLHALERERGWPPSVCCGAGTITPAMTGATSTDFRLVRAAMHGSLYEDA